MSLLPSGAAGSAPPRPTIRPAAGTDIASVCRLLLEDFHWDGDKASIRRLLTHEWSPAGTPRAMVAEAEGRIVGFLATILSPWPREDAGRTGTTGREALIGSFSFYHVLPAYRAVSLPLLRAALALADRWTSLSPNAYSQAILKMAGFRVLSEGFRFHRPGGSGWRRRGWRARAATRDELAAAGFSRLADDHAPYGCRAFIALNGADRVIVMTRRRPAGSGWVQIPVSEVLFVSNPQGLARAWPSLCPVIAWGDRTVLVALDDVFDPQHRIAGGRARARVRLARGLTETHQPDALYSELVLLN